MIDIEGSDCLLQGVRDAIAAEGYKRVDAIALADLACYVSQIMAGGAAERMARVHVAELMAAGRKTLERRAGR